jgi:hypothetical protein
MSHHFLQKPMDKRAYAVRWTSTAGALEVGNLLLRFAFDFLSNISMIDPIAD